MWNLEVKLKKGVGTSPSALRMGQGGEVDAETGKVFGLQGSWQL